MLAFLSKFFKSDGGKFRGTVEEINALEKEIAGFSIAELEAESKKLQEELRAVTSWEEQKALLDERLPRAFALVRETAKRTLGQRHFDVQLMGGIALHNGSIVEMRTGEGKTLSATAPAYLNALAGRGVHVVTVNEYLAKRDAVWMGQVYHALGLRVACLVHEGAFAYDPQYSGVPSKRVVKEGVVSDEPLREGSLIDKERDTTGSFMVQTEYLRPIPRREAYEADITYGTNHEFGFDYLRDNLAHSRAAQVQRTPHFAIIDEVDSILIDEARTPLIISAPDAESSQFYKTFARVVARLKRDEDYLVDEKMRSVDITEAGIDSVERAVGIKNIYAPEYLRLVHYLQESLRAKELFIKDRDYVVKDGEIIIVDQFTGRLMLGRRYSGGLHQAIEAKEDIRVQQESRTYASISIQNYFRLYQKLGGMTGTAQTSAEEFHKVYNLEVVTIPTHRPMVREDFPDLVYKTREAKYNAIIKDIRERHEKGQPILVGTVSIEKNEELSNRLSRAGLKHEVLNAKNNEREGAIIAQAGRRGAITVATNMAGRGVDIILGGNPLVPEEAEKVKAAGGLHVVGTERHESRRIDNQLRGRAGRQGDPGSSQFFLSLEDDLMRIFGGERVGRLMATLRIPDDMAIQAGMINRVLAQAQGKVEGNNFDARKHLLEYDDVLNKQRLAMYRKRQELLTTHNLQLTTNTNGKNSDEEHGAHIETVFKVSPGALSFALSAFDMFWMNHLENMEALQESVRLRAYGQHDPLVEYRREGHVMFQEMLSQYAAWMKENEAKLQESSTTPELSHPPVPHSHAHAPNDAKIGRNDPCPCGAINPATGEVYKYKKCGLINAPHHRN
jgi:preprotein translocase subunit SecA